MQDHENRGLMGLLKTYVNVIQSDLCELLDTRARDTGLDTLYLI